MNKMLSNEAFSPYCHEFSNAIAAAVEYKLFTWKFPQKQPTIPFLEEVTRR